MSDAKASSPYSKDRPYLARLVENRVLNREGSAKDTRHLVVDISGSGIGYSCGDSLGVYPTNRASEVDALLTALDATGDEPVTPPRSDETVSLREALSTRVALAGPTKRSIMAFRDAATDAADRARLEALLEDSFKEELKVFLEQREFIDLLEEYPGVEFTPQGFVDMLKRLAPRLYSIASSPVVHPDHIHLTVAVVRYETNGRDRIGVASTYLAERAALNEHNLPVFVADSHFGLPEDPDVDIIMVGPGTGIAPFRAFLQERIARASPGRNWLFFGDQHRATDYLYGDELDQWKADGKLDRLDLAFSRDQAHKIYVQDRIRENAAEIWQWLEGGAIFYVCGDAKRMAKDVDQALHQIAEEQGGMDADEAKAWVKQLRRDKRYQRDVY